MRKKAETETYEFTPDDINILIARELKISPDRVKSYFVVERKYNGDWQDDGSYEMTKVNVTVDKMIIKQLNPAGLYGDR